jgi:hypothetical protein
MNTGTCKKKRLKIAHQLLKKSQVHCLSFFCDRGNDKAGLKLAEIEIT